MPKYKKIAKGHSFHHYTHKAKPNRFRALHKAAVKLKHASHQQEEDIDEEEMTEALDDVVDTTEEFTQDLQDSPLESAKKYSETFLKNSAELLGTMNEFLQSSNSVSPQFKETLNKVFKILDQAIKMLLGNFSMIFKDPRRDNKHGKSHDEEQDYRNQARHR